MTPPPLFCCNGGTITRSLKTSSYTQCLSIENDKHGVQFSVSRDRQVIERTSCCSRQGFLRVTQASFTTVRIIRLGERSCLVTQLPWVHGCKSERERYGVSSTPPSIQAYPPPRPKNCTSSGPKRTRWYRLWASLPPRKRLGHAYFFAPRPSILEGGCAQPCHQLSTL